MVRSKALMHVGLLVAALPVASALAAEGGEGGTLEEIVVTAQKRVESVQDVPVSITVISNEQLTRAGVSTLSDLSRTSASVEFGAPGTSSPGGGAYVRGIGTNSFGYTAQASVGLVLDGVVMGNTNILSLFDIQRVEVLKGPQGTLFGNSVSAGVINITTNAPDPSKKSLTINGEYGADALGSDYSRYQVRATANMPITDTSAIRVSVHSESNDGVFKNTWLGTESSNPDQGVRVRYLAKPTDNFTVNLIADYDKVNLNDAPGPLLYRAAPAGSALALALADCGNTAGESNFDFCSENENISREITRGVSAQLDWGIGNDLTLTSISSYRGRYTASRGDIMGIPLSISSDRFQAFTKCAPPPGPPPWPPGFDIGCVGIYAIQPGYGPTGLQTHDKRQYSEELRLASGQNKHLEWVAGLFFLDYKNDIAEGGRINAFFSQGVSIPGMPANYLPTGKFGTVKTQDYAGFGNLTWYITPRVRAILGARWTHSKVSETVNDVANHPAPFPLTVTANQFNYRLGGQFDVAQHAMVYATVSTGYKGPQISDSFDNGALPFGVKPEVPTALELGIKASAFDDRLAIDADVFYTKVKDYQGQECQPNSQGTITCVPANISGVKTKGVEVDIFGRPIQGLTLNFTGIYNPADYPDGVIAADGTDLGGTQLTRSSKTKFTLSAEYAHPIGGSVDFVIGADTTYRSKQSIYPSADSQFVVKAGTITNARVGLKSGDDWGLYLFGRNLGNTHFPRDLFPTPFQAGGLWQVYDAGALKIIGVQLDAKF
jgi:iron complex outermembrane receptor protein